MNKAKIFVLTLTLTICISILSITVLLYSISSKIDLNFDLNTVEPLSYINDSITPQIQGDKTEKYLVVDIVDGDTIKVMENDQKKTIRLIGIDAPEVKSKDCKYQEATNKLTDLILNKYIELESDSTQSDLDRYGRELRYVFINGVNVNQEIVSSGLATEYTYNKPYIYQYEFLQAQSSAKAQQLGIWSNECLK